MKKGLFVLVMSSLFFASCKKKVKQKKIGAIVNQEKLKTEDSKSAYHVKISFEKFYEVFVNAIKTKDVKKIQKLTELNADSDIKDIEKEYDNVFTKEVVKKILSDKKSSIDNYVFKDGRKGKVLPVHITRNYEGDEYESSTIFRFCKTANGWRLLSIKIAG